MIDIATILFTTLGCLYVAYRAAILDGRSPLFPVGAPPASADPASGLTGESGTAPGGGARGWRERARRAPARRP